MSNIKFNIYSVKYCSIEIPKELYEEVEIPKEFCNVAVNEYARLKNGEGYFQHSISQILEYRDKADNLFREITNIFHITSQTHVSYIVRILGDLNSPLQKCYQRLYCINMVNGREWGQPYFALNPEKGKQVKLN